MSARPTSRQGNGPEKDRDTTSDVMPARIFHDKASHPLYRAFSAPSGLLGRMAGAIMARRNYPLNRYAVSILDVQPGERVLEIGFGPGKGLELLAGLVGARGMVHGVDISQQMLRVASGRNRRSIGLGTMELALGRADALPYPDHSFARILSVSTVQFWNPATRSLAELFRVLEPGGRVVLGLHTMEQGSGTRIPGLYPDEVRELVGMIRDAGFVNIELHEPTHLDFQLCIAAHGAFDWPGQTSLDSVRADSAEDEGHSI